MLDPAAVRKVRELLEVGVSRRRAAKRTGVSRNRVIRIARNLYPDYEALRQARKRMQTLPSHTVDRCRTCGATVRMPCLACHVSQLLASGARRPYGTDLGHAPQSPLHLQLKETHRRRYDEVRAKRDWPRRGPSGPEKRQAWR